MHLRTRLTERLGIEHPIISAPMGFVSGGRLAAAVSNAGGLGLIGGGYGDAEWLQREFLAAGNARVGCGFITWSLANNPALLDQVLERQPAALMLSFGSPAPFAERIRQAGVPLICQVQSMAHARAAVDAGADIVVAQGGEAGGHGGHRATFTLVPEIADFLAGAAPDDTAGRGRRRWRRPRAGGSTDAGRRRRADRHAADRHARGSNAAGISGGGGCRRRRRDGQDDGGRRGAQLSVAERIQRPCAQEPLRVDLARPRRSAGGSLDQRCRERALLERIPLRRHRQHRRLHGRGRRRDQGCPAGRAHCRGHGDRGRPATRAGARHVID